MNERIEMTSLEDTLPTVTRLPLDDTLMTLLLMSDQPFIAVDGNIGGAGRGASEKPSCLLVRIEERWARA